MSNAQNHSGSPAFADVRKPQLLKRGLLVYALLVLVLGWSYGLWHIRADRIRTLDSSSSQLLLTAAIMAGNLEAMINDGVGAAAAGASEINALDQSTPLSDAEMPDILARMLTGGEYVHTLFVITPTRFITARRGGLTGRAERPAWTTQLLAVTGDTWVGKPLNTELGDMSVLIPIAKRVGSMRGEPTWAGALLSVYPMDRMFGSMPLKRSAVSLITLDGTVLVRLPIVPGAHTAGMDLRSSEVYRKYQQMGPKPMTLEAPDPISGKLRQVAIRQVRPYEVVATSGRNVEDSLVPWQERSRSAIWTLSIASLALMLLTGALHVLLQRRFAAITRSEQRFQLAVAGTNDGIWEWDINTDQVYYSPRFKYLLGVTDGDDFPPVLATFWRLVHPDDVRPIELALQRHLLHRDLYDIEFRMQTRDAGYKWFRARGQAVWDEHGKAMRMAGSISDIHDKRLAESNLEQSRQAELTVRRELAQNLLLGQEQERLRLANELHDSVGQNLSLIKNHTLMLLQQRDLPPAVLRHATALEELATEVIGEVRAVAHNLRPPLLEELGLTAALDSLVTTLSKSVGLRVEKRLEVVDDVIDGATATHLFRIAQEAVNNILKHSQATQCKLWLQRDFDCVRLSITDNGIGFEANARRGLGLSSMEERCRMLSAVCTVRSTVGAGTEILVEVPVVASSVAADAAIQH